MKERIEKAVKALAEKSEASKNSNDALKYTQAVLNLANALCTLKNAES